MSPSSRRHLCAIAKLSGAATVIVAGIWSLFLISFASVAVGLPIVLLVVRDERLSRQRQRVMRMSAGVAYVALAICFHLFWASAPSTSRPHSPELLVTVNLFSGFSALFTVLIALAVFDGVRTAYRHMLATCE